MNEELAREVIEFAESKGCNFYSDYHLTIVTSQSQLKNLDKEIERDLLSSVKEGVGAIATTAKGETTTQIFLYPQDTETDVDKVIFTKHLLHELRHHIQREELRDYKPELEHDYNTYIQQGKIRDEHWSEIDADVFSLNFIVNHQNELSKILNVNKEVIKKVETFNGEYVDFEQKRQEYQRLREERK